MDKPQDRTPLPSPTRDVEQAKRDFDAFGLCLIDGNLEGERLARVRERLYSTAADDARLRARSAQGDYDTTNQRVWGLLNRGQENRKTNFEWGDRPSNLEGMGRVRGSNVVPRKSPSHWA
jgi:hypothetical protein